MEATVTADNGTEDCTLTDHVAYNFYYDDANVDILMGFYSDYYGYANVLFSGYGLPSYGYYGPYWMAALTYDGSYYGSSSFDGSTLAWTFTSQGYDYSDNYYSYCDYVGSSYATSAYAGSLSGTSDLPCGDSSTVDIWEVVADGGTISVTVDSVAEETKGDLAMWMNGDDGCTQFYADDNHDCTYPLDEYGCPSLQETVDAGTYQVAVFNWAGGCDSTVVEYELLVDGASSVTLVQDDAARYTETPYTISTSGSGTVTEAN